MQTINATDFKATCLELLDRVGAGEIEELAITKRGQVVAILCPPRPTAADAASLHGCLRGLIDIPDDLDLTAPVFEGDINAELGKLARMTGVLLDTCALMWTAQGVEIQASAQVHISDAVLGSGVFVSPVSAWEIGLLGIRGRLGRLSSRTTIESWLGLFMARPGIRQAPFTAAIALESACLPDLDHRDPADRFLIATARTLALPIVTRDRAILAYGRAGHVECIPC